MTGFKLRIYGVGSDRSTTCATSTARDMIFYIIDYCVNPLLPKGTVIKHGPLGEESTRVAA